MLHLLLLALQTGPGLQAAGPHQDNLQYGFCEGANQPMYLAYINIQPWPIVLSANEKLTILAHITLKQNITVGSRVVVDIKKMTEGVEVAVPCLDSNMGPLGSCNYSGDAFTETFFHHFFCPDHDVSQPCTLPLLTGEYGQQYDDPYYVTLPNISLDMNWFLTGTFNIQLTVLDSFGEEFTCLQFVVEVEQKQEPTTSTAAPTESETCSDCLFFIDEVLSKLEEDDWLEMQEKFLLAEACVESPQSASCQHFLWHNWSGRLSTCLYSRQTEGWRLDQLTCLWYGQCQGTSKFWQCSEVVHQLAATLASPDIAPGATRHLHDDCCGSVISDPDCQPLVKEVTPFLLPALASWIRNSTGPICADNGSVTTTSLTLSTLIAVLCTFFR